MRRNPSAPWLHLALLFLLAFGSPTHAATSCAAGNPDTTHVVESTPTSDFTVNGDDTVTHVKTGLMWKQCVEGLSGAACTDRASTVTVPSSSAPIIATTMTWANALNAAKTANTAAFAGYTDWRLPNKKELESIIESCGTYPSINQTVFPNTPSSDFWSATSYVLDPTIAWDIYFGWGTTRNFSAKTTLFNVRLVRGDHSVDSFDLLNPTPTPTSTPKAFEFYNAGINHYFMTASSDEAVALDNKPSWGWARTGKTFNIWQTQSSALSNASPVCRFYGVFANGTVGSHFYTVDTGECAYVKSRLDWGWDYEGDAFYVVKPVGGACPAGTSPVYRAYNNGMGGAPNHRYMTSQADVNTMVSQGWLSEGTTFCRAQ